MLQNTVRVQNCYIIILLIVYEDILIPINPGDGWRMRVQVLPGLVVRRPGFEARIAQEVAEVTPKSSQLNLTLTFVCGGRKTVCPFFYVLIQIV